MEALSELLQNVMPQDFNAMAFLQFLLVLLIGSVLFALIGRFAFGRRSPVNHVISSTMGILFMYAVTVVVATCFHDYAKYLTPMPFVVVQGDYMHILPIFDAGYLIVCSHVLRMVILAFIVNLLDIFLPEARKLFGWLFRYIVIIGLSFLLQGLVSWLFASYAPQALVDWAPFVLVGILLVAVLVGVLKVALGITLAAINPIIAAVYAFFFSNKIGKQLSKAILTTILLVLIVCALNWFGITAICISTEALKAYIPLLVIIVLLWFFIGKVL